MAVISTPVLENSLKSRIGSLTTRCRARDAAYAHVQMGSYNNNGCKTLLLPSRFRLGRHRWCNREDLRSVRVIALVAQSL